jgi:hypothetical protein
MHADNCADQNKNYAMLHYCSFLSMWLGSPVVLSFMVAGHTKFLPDAVFGALKQLYRKEDVHTLMKLIELILKVNKNNHVMTNSETQTEPVSEPHSETDSDSHSHSESEAESDAKRRHSFSFVDWPSFLSQAFDVPSSDSSFAAVEQYHSFTFFPTGTVYAKQRSCDRQGWDTHVIKEDFKDYAADQLLEGIPEKKSKPLSEFNVVYTGLTSERQQHLQNIDKTGRDMSLICTTPRILSAEEQQWMNDVIGLSNGMTLSSSSSSSSSGPAAP